MATGVDNYEVLGHDRVSCCKIAEALEDRYVLYKRKYVKIRDPKKMSQWEKERNISPTTTEKKPLDFSYLLDHLRGDYAVGVFAGPKATKFMCIDIDMMDPDVVHKVVDTLDQMGIPRDRIYISISGGKGYHVDIYIKDKIFNNRAVTIYNEMLRISGLDRSKVEYWPTSGHGVKLPLGVHQKTGRRCWYVDRETLEPIEDLDYIYSTGYVEEALINEIAQKIQDREYAELYKKISAERPTKENPGGKYHTPSGFDVTSTGTRHMMQMKYAIYLRKHGATQSQLVRDQMSWYDRQNKSLISTSREDAEVESYDIADWCIRNVAVVYDTFTPKKAPLVKITQREIACILSATTPAHRRVAFYIFVYCLRYGFIKIAYDTIASNVSVSRDRVCTAVDWLCKQGLIKKERSFRKINGCYINDSNRYELSGTSEIQLIPKRYQKKEYIEIDNWLTNKTFSKVYARVLNSLCTNAYLKKNMQPKEYEQYMEGLRNDSE